MSKSKHRKHNDWYDDYEEDDFYSSKQREENKNRRKMKRMKAALRTKDIDTLMRYDEEDI